MSSSTEIPDHLEVQYLIQKDEVNFEEFSKIYKYFKIGLRIFLNLWISRSSPNMGNIMNLQILFADFPSMIEIKYHKITSDKSNYNFYLTQNFYLLSQLTPDKLTSLLCIPRKSKNFPKEIKDNYLTVKNLMVKIYIFMRDQFIWREFLTHNQEKLTEVISILKQKLPYHIL